MKLSPDFPHDLLCFVLSFLKVLVLSAGVGFIFYKVAMNLREAWKAKNRLKIWLYLSLACFGLHVLIIGIK
jgi:predicted membrane channel-forming protein YqfA (hemolysin III family)